MGHRDATTTQRKYIHLFNRQRTDDQVRDAMWAWSWAVREGVLR
jgi:hypothetical protein